MASVWDLGVCDGWIEDQEEDPKRSSSDVFDWNINLLLLAI
jgi:hypothetical protein